MYFFLTLFVFVTPVLANICQNWSVPVKVSTLEKDIINESSGIAFSNLFNNTVYHNNDSGDGPYFYVSDALGGNTQKIPIDKFEPIDVEDIAVGPCPQANSCVFIADIGDNNELRPEIEILFFPEIKFSPAKAIKAQNLFLQYPDGANNAEAFAVHPKSGDLYILTKKSSKGKHPQALVAGLYKTPSLSLKQALEKKHHLVLLEKVGEINIPKINYDHSVWGQIATAMDFDPSGDKLAILTYENIIEVLWSSMKAPINTDAWIAGKDYTKIPTKGLTSQQEAIAYSPDGKSLYFTSEFNKKQDADVPLFKVDCQ